MKPSFAFFGTLLLSFAALAAIAAISQNSGTQNQAPPKEVQLAATDYVAPEGRPLQRAVLAGGCFWGLEKHLRETPGITATAAGYIGGTTPNPTYEQVCTGKTGHAEAVLVEFDPARLSYRQLLERFWQIHNPCTINQQGPDRGTQYRSAIFTYNDQQQEIAEASKKESARLFKRPIVTEIVPAGEFYMAEDYHQQYAQKTGRACAIDRSDHVGGGF